MIVIAIYVVYSHETGNTATNFKNDVVESINESSDGFKGYNPKKTNDEG